MRRTPPSKRTDHLIGYREEILTPRGQLAAFVSTLPAKVRPMVVGYPLTGWEPLDYHQLTTAEKRRLRSWLQTYRRLLRRVVKYWDREKFGQAQVVDDYFQVYLADRDWNKIAPSKGRPRKAPADREDAKRLLLVQAACARLKKGMLLREKLVPPGRFGPELEMRQQLAKRGYLEPEVEAIVAARGLEDAARRLVARQHGIDPPTLRASLSRARRAASST